MVISIDKIFETYDPTYMNKWINRKYCYYKLRHSLDDEVINEKKFIAHIRQLICF